LRVYRTCAAGSRRANPIASDLSSDLKLRIAAAENANAGHALARSTPAGGRKYAIG
jgi:hypothetical protein